VSFDRKFAGELCEAIVPLHRIGVVLEDWLGSLDIIDSAETLQDLLHDYCGVPKDSDFSQRGQPGYFTRDEIDEHLWLLMEGEKRDDFTTDPDIIAEKHIAWLAEKGYCK